PTRLLDQRNGNGISPAETFASARFQRARASATAFRRWDALPEPRQRRPTKAVGAGLRKRIPKSIPKPPKGPNWLIPVCRPFGAGDSLGDRVPSVDTHSYIIPPLRGYAPAIAFARTALSSQPRM